jgi:hypothetical protein
MAFDTVAFESRNSAAASAKERHSATFAKMASPSRSGSLAMALNLETVGFDSFYFSIHPLSIESATARALHHATTAGTRSAGEASRLREGSMEPHTRGIRRYPSTSALLASSARLGWSTISVELRAHGASEAPAIVPQHVEICLVVAGSEDGLLKRTGAGFCQEARPGTGAIWLSPAGIGKEIVITAPIPQTMHLYLPTALFERLNNDFNLPAAPAHSIRHAAGIIDGVIDQIGRSILSGLPLRRRQVAYTSKPPR